MKRIVPVTQNLSAALPALALSFAADPFYRAITAGFQEPGEKQRVLERYFAYSLEEARRTGHCVVARNPSLGAAAWLLPCAADVEATESDAKHAFLQRLLGRIGYGNYKSILEYMSVRAKRCVDDGAWYLSIVGVHPAAQGTDHSARRRSVPHEPRTAGRQRTTDKPHCGGADGDHRP